MGWSRVVRYFLCFALLFGVLVGLTGNRTALATQESSNGPFLLSLNQEEAAPQEKLDLFSKFPVLPGNSGDGFTFEVELTWHGSEFKTFDLVTTPPSGWRAATVAGQPQKEVPAIGLQSEMTRPDRVAILFAPLFGEQPEPGDYVVTLEASSDDIKETIELTARVTDLYMFYFITDTEKLNFEVTAGKENHLSLKVGNTGTAVIDKIDLTSSKPEGWKVTFNPDRVEALEPGLAQEVNVVIKLPAKTIAGDYMLTMQTISADMASRTLDLRVTVLTPTIWGWVGISIVLAVIAGVAVIFRRLGRR